MNFYSRLITIQLLFGYEGWLQQIVLELRFFFFFLRNGPKVLVGENNTFNTRKLGAQAPLGSCDYGTGHKMYVPRVHLFTFQCSLNAQDLACVQRLCAMDVRWMRHMSISLYAVHLLFVYCLRFGLACIQCLCTLDTR